MSAAMYVYDEYKSEAAALAQAAKLAHRGAIVRAVKSRGTWNVLVSDAQPGEARLVSFQATREAYNEEEFAAEQEAEQEAARSGREHIVREGHALYSSYRYAFRPYSEYRDEPPVEWIVRGVLPKAELAVIYGESGSGKSNLALDMAAAIGAGVDWCGHKTSKGRVCIFAGEAAKGLKQRAKAYKSRHAEMPDGDMPWIEGAALNLCDAKDVAELARTLIAQGPVALCILDTLASVFVGNENSGEHVGLALRNCRFLHQKTGATIALIHHTGHSNTDRARGHSSLRAAADSEIEVSRNGDYRQWRVAKQRDGSDAGIGGKFKLDVVSLGADENFEPVTSCVVSHVTAPAPVRKPRARPKAVNQETTLQHLEARRCVLSFEELVDEIGERLDCSSPKYRTQALRRAINGLVHGKWIYGFDGDRYGLSGVIAGDSDDSF